MEAQQNSVRPQELQAKVFQEKFAKLSYALEQNMMSQINGEIKIIEEVQQLDELILIQS